MKCLNKTISAEIKTHTALHVLKGAIQKVIGAKLTTSVYTKDTKGRIAVQFNRKPNEEEIMAIEKEANDCIKRNEAILMFEMDRKKAEEKFGNIIYDAFPVPIHITKLKITNIEEWNINCCLHEHTKTTGEIGQIKINDLRFRNNKQLLEISFEIYSI